MNLAENLLLVIGALVLVSIVAAAFSPRLGAPLLLVFLIIGMLAGVDGPGGIVFDSYPLANLAGIAALAVILFDGGLRTRISDFRIGLGPAMTLSTFGVLITASITGAFAAWVLGLPWLEGLLIGAIVSSTDAAAVFSLLAGRGDRINKRVASVLEIESGSNDPMAVMLTLGILMYLGSPNGFGLSQGVEFLALQMFVGAGMGVGGGYALAYAARRLNMGESLYPLLALFSGLFIFGLTASLGGSGFLAVYLAGLIFANAKVPRLIAIRRFHDVVAWLAQIGLFVMLGLLVIPSQLLTLALPALAVALVLIFVARPVAVLTTLWPFKLAKNEMTFIGWVGLRGSVPIVLATYPWLTGLPHASIVFDVVFFIVLVSLVLQGWSVASAARLLKLSVPSPTALVHRVDFDLPGSRGHEIVSYRLDAGSALIGCTPDRVPLGDRGQLVCVVRRGHALYGDSWTSLEAGDYVSILTSMDELHDLDRIFRGAPRDRPTRLRTFFGDFVISPDAPLSALAAEYGAQLPEGSEDQSVGSFAEQHLPRPVVGDRLRLGLIELVIREMDGEKVTAFGLRLPDEAAEQQAVT